MKIEHILFPTDFSERSRAVTADVEYLADYFGARVTLMHVFEIPATWYGTAEASIINTDCFNLFLDSAKQNLQKFQIGIPESRIERVLAEGDAAWHITDWARNNKVDLIMMGSRGHGRLQGLLLGSVVAKVMHDVDCPIWTESCFHSLFKKGFSRVSEILCAIDLDAEAASLLQYASALAREFGAKVQVIHSVPEAETRPNKYFDFDLHRYLTERARVEISKIQREAGTDFPVDIESGSIRHALHEATVQYNPDLILIGRGKTQDTFGRLRTHIFEIIHDALCPVLSCSPYRQDRISSSCTEEHLSQYEVVAPPPIGSQKLCSVRPR
jgi:nucleotide-binding universal stress UspA family protein